MAEKRKSSGRDMDEVQVSSRGNKVRATDLVDVYNVPEKWARMRYHGPIHSYGIHWVKTKTKDGKPTKFPTPCLAFDAETGKRDSTLHCPWCEHGDEDQVQFGVEYWSNAIIRSLQKQKPEEVTKPTKEEVKTGFKDKDSETWTPNRAVKLTAGLLRALKELKPLNIHEGPEGDSIPFSVSHTKYGCDVMVKYNKDAAQASRYGVQKGDPKPLSKEERALLTYDISDLHPLPTLAEAKAEYKSWLERMNGKKKKSSDDDDDEDEAPKKGKKVVDEDDDDDEDEAPAPKKPAKKKPAVLDDDEDDDPPPKAKSKGKKVVDEDDDDDDEDLDEDDEDDDPPPKSKAKPAAKTKKKVVDDDDEDDEDDEPPVKKGKKPVKKAVLDDDEDEDDDEDDDPPPKAKAKAKPPAKKKPAVMDDDEDEDEDDDEDDEPPPRKKKKKVVDDDDE